MINGTLSQNIRVILIDQLKYNQKELFKNNSLQIDIHHFDKGVGLGRYRDGSVGCWARLV